MAQNHTSKRMISHQKMNLEGEAPPIVAYRRLVLVQSLFAGDIPNLVAKLALQPTAGSKSPGLILPRNGQSQSNRKTPSSCFKWRNQIVIHSKASTLHLYKGSKIQSCSQGFRFPAMVAIVQGCKTREFRGSTVPRLQSLTCPTLQVSCAQEVPWTKGSIL